MSKIFSWSLRLADVDAFLDYATLSDVGLPVEAVARNRASLLPSVGCLTLSNYDTLAGDSDCDMRHALCDYKTTGTNVQGYIWL